MRILNLTSVTVASTATTNGTATDFTATRKSPFTAGASAALALQLVAASSATVNVQTSTDGGSTYATAKDTDGNNISVAVTAAETDTRYFNVASIGDLMRIQVVAASTAGGSVRGTLIQN